MDTDGLVWLSSPVQGRRKKNIPCSNNELPPITCFLNFGRITFTTIQNNFNLPRIFGFRAKLQTRQFVLTPSCATIKPNRGYFPGEGNPKPLKFSGFKTCNSFLFIKAPEKTAPFSAVSGQLASRTTCNR